MTATAASPERVLAPQPAGSALHPEPSSAAVAPLQIGPLRVDPPVVLAPMAGVTNAAFRQLCREQLDGGLFVSEMITSRALVERDAETMRMIRFAPSEQPRSLQLYGVDPEIVGRAVQIVVDEDRADHIDLNFGCPVPKVTRRGGGAALPWKLDLLQAILRSAVHAAGGRIPVTMKMRTGIDSDHLTYLDAGRLAEREGIAAVALHGRTAAQSYSGRADWTAIARLKDHVTTIPVLGNGDIWEATDAVRMVRETGCDGVVVGRGCLGRPWLFAQLAAALTGRQQSTVVVDPDLGGVSHAIRRHAALLAEFLGEERGCREIRKHVAWYLKGFPVGPTTRQRLGTVATLEELDTLLSTLDHGAAYPPESVGAPRGRTNSPRPVALPDGWLADRALPAALVDHPLSAPPPAAALAAVRLDRDAELAVSGG